MVDTSIEHVVHLYYIHRLNKYFRNIMIGRCVEQGVEI